MTHVEVIYGDIVFSTLHIFILDWHARILWHVFGTLSRSTPWVINGPYSSVHKSGTRDFARGILMSSSLLWGATSQNIIVWTKCFQRVHASQGDSSYVSFRARRSHGEYSCPARQSSFSMLALYILLSARRIHVPHVRKTDPYLSCSWSKSLSFILHEPDLSSCAPRGGAPCDVTCLFGILLSPRGSDISIRGGCFPCSSSLMTFPSCFPLLAWRSHYICVVTISLSS